MGPRVRAKFRCLSITQKYDGLITAELRAVMNKGGKNYEENKMFWEYSPNGECDLTFFAKHTLEIGAYYYIDMERVEHPEGVTDLWLLNAMARYDGGGGSVEMHHSKSYDWQKGRPEGLLGGRLKISMDAKAEGALKALNQPGTKWKVDFNFAEPSDGTT